MALCWRANPLPPLLLSSSLLCLSLSLSLSQTHTEKQTQMQAHSIQSVICLCTWYSGTHCGVDCERDLKTGNIIHPGSFQYQDESSGPDYLTSDSESVLFSMAIIVLSGPDHSPVTDKLEIIQPRKNDLHRWFICLWLSPSMSPKSPLPPPEVQIIQIFFPSIVRADN